MRVLRFVFLVQSVLDLVSTCVETQLAIHLSKCLHLSKFISSSPTSQGCVKMKHCTNKRHVIMGGDDNIQQFYYLLFNSSHKFVGS